MIVNIDFLDEQVADSLIEAKELGLSFEEFVLKALDDHLDRIKMKNAALNSGNYRALVNDAVQRVEVLQAGETFILKDLFKDRWEQVSSPSAFGRSFRKEVEKKGLAKYKSRRSDNKIIYVKL